MTSIAKPIPATPAFKLTALHTSQTPPASFPFTFPIAPRTDLWRKPPATFSSNQPTFYTSITLKSLHSASVNIARIPYSELYDQAGLVLIWAGHPETWIKAGVEYYEGELRRSVIAPGIGGWSDWSIAGPVDGNEDITVSVEREKDNGSALIFKVGGKIVREIQGVFVPKNEEQEVWLGIFGARPADVDGVLEVEFASFEVNVV